MTSKEHGGCQPQRREVRREDEAPQREPPWVDTTRSMAFCEAVLVLALVLVVAARGGRGDVAAQPLYEREFLKSLHAN